MEKKRDTVFHKNINLNYGLITELKINRGEYENQYLLFSDTIENRTKFANEVNDKIKEILPESNGRKTFHSTRSSFRTYLENTDFKESFINDLMGHSQKGMGNVKYVKNRDINIKREIINSIDYSVENEAWN